MFELMVREQEDGRGGVVPSSKTPASWGPLSDCSLTKQLRWGFSGENRHDIIPAINHFSLLLIHRILKCPRKYL